MQKNFGINSTSDNSAVAAFANELEKMNGDFGLVRGIANSARHLALQSKRSNEDAPNRASLAQITMSGYGQFGYGMRPWGDTARVTLKTTDEFREFAEIAKSVFEMWRQLSRKYDFGLD